MNDDQARVKRVEDFLLDPEKALFTTLDEFKVALNTILPILQGIDFNTLATLQGEDGKTPQRGVDYMTQEDIDALEAFILSKMPRTDVDYPSVEATEAFIRSEIAKIPRIKGDKGEPGTPGEKGRDGSRDTGADILKKLRTLGRNQGLQIDDIRGLENRIKFYNTVADEFYALRDRFDNQKIVIPANPGSGGGSGAVAWGDITGTLADQTDLQTALDTKANIAGSLTQFIGNTAWRVFYSNGSGDIVELALGADGTFLKSNGASSAPTFSVPAGSGDVVGPASAVDNRVVFFDGVSGKLIKDSGLTLSGSNTGDQTSIVGITGTLAEFNAALTGADFATGGGTATGTNTGDQTSIVGITGTIAQFNTALTDGDFATGGGVITGTSSGTNTGDQTSIVGITGTKAQFDTALSDGNFLYVGDITQYTDEMAQDAVGAMISTAFTYTDGTPLLALTSRTIGGVAYDGTANITVATATGGFTVSGGNLALGTNSLTLTGSIGATGARATKVWATDVESTNMYTVGGTSLSSTFAALAGNVAQSFGASTIELGHASANTLSASGGVLSIESVVIPTISSTNTLTNKRITKRVQSVADAATITPAADSDDCVDITAIAQAFTIANPSGTPTNFQQIIIRIKDNGTARAITWGSNFVAGGVALPSTTVLSKILTLGFIYNTANALNKWQLVASAQEA